MRSDGLLWVNSGCTPLPISTPDVISPDMDGTGGNEAAQPLVEPRVIQFLKDRPRLVDKGLREEFLEQLELNIRNRRVPDTMAERSVQQLFNRVEEAGGGVAKERLRKRMERANKTVLNDV